MAKVKKEKLNRNKLFIREDKIQRLWFTDSKTGNLIMKELICGDVEKTKNESENGNDRERKIS